MLDVVYYVWTSRKHPVYRLSYTFAIHFLLCTLTAPLYKLQTVYICSN